jgi:hypothetical protein
VRLFLAKYCGTATPMLGTKSCNACWNLDTALGSVPRAVVAEILEAHGYSIERRLA